MTLVLVFAGLLVPLLMPTVLIAGAVALLLGSLRRLLSYIRIW